MHFGICTHKSSIRQKGMSAQPWAAQARNKFFRRRKLQLSSGRRRSLSFRACGVLCFISSCAHSIAITDCLLFTHKGASQVQKERIARDKGGHWRIPFVRRSLTASHGRKEFSFSACTTSAFLPLNRKEMMLPLHLTSMRSALGSLSGERKLTHARTSVFPHGIGVATKCENTTCVNVFEQQARADLPVFWPPRVRVCSDFFHYLLVKPLAAPFATSRGVSRGRQMLQLCAYVKKRAPLQ